jgi:SAM-dependent methyltransferase
VPLSEKELRRRLAAQPWTSHNIALTDSIATMPGQPDFMKTDQRLKALLRVLALCCPGASANLRVADLGCLEGGFSLALAQLGMNVVGIEARVKNLEKARLLKEHFDLTNLEFKQGDVKDFTRDAFGEFDVVLALGILYHLDQPAAWLRQIAEATGRVLIIDSHYAPDDDASMALIDERIAQLSALDHIEDGAASYEGRWFFEYGEDDEREDQLWASYSNRKSFWFTKESLLRAISSAGFDLVLEQHDYSAAMYKFFTIKFPRVMLVAVKDKNLIRR